MTIAPLENAEDDMLAQVRKQREKDAEIAAQKKTMQKKENQKQAETIPTNQKEEPQVKGSLRKMKARIDKV
jgi:small-conductance mechanosensitive channel